MKNQSNTTVVSSKALLFAALGILGFSGTLPATKIATAELSVVQVGLGRAVVAAVCAGLYLLCSLKTKLPRRGEWVQLFAVVLGVVVGFPLLSAWALGRIDAGHAAIVISLTPICTAAMGAVRERKTLPFQFWAASLLGAILVAFYLYWRVQHVLHTAAGTALFATMMPQVALILAALCASVGYTEGAILSRRLGGMHVISWALILALPITLPLVLWHGIPHPQSASVWLAMAYVSCISMFAAFAFWYRGLAEAGVSRASQIQLAQPILSILWASLFLGEALDSKLLFVAAGVITSIYFASRQSRSKAPFNAQLPPPEAVRT